MRSASTYRAARRNEWRADRELTWSFYRHDNEKLAQATKLRGYFNPSRTYK